MNNPLRKVVQTLEDGLNLLEYFDGEARLAVNCLDNDRYHKFLIKKANALVDLFSEMPEGLKIRNWEKKLSHFSRRVGEIKQARDSKDYSSLSWLTNEAWLRVLYNELRALI